MSKPENFIKKNLKALLNYTTPALLIFFILSHLTWRWNYMVEQFIGRYLFFGVLAASVITLIVLHRRSITGFFRLVVGRIILVAAFFAILIYQKVHLVEFLIITYALFAFISFFIEKDAIKNYIIKTVEIVIDIFNNEGRTPAIFALLCFVTIPVLLIFGRYGAAEQLGIYAFYFLVLTLVLQIVEVKLSIRRENPLMILFAKLYIYCKNALNRVAESTRKITWSLFWRSTFSRVLCKTGIFMVILLIIIFVQSLYWKKLSKTIDMNPAYQSQVSLVNHVQKKIIFTPTSNEIKILIRVTHPFSNPRVWLNTGMNPVKIEELWFEHGNTGDPADAVFERYHDLDKPMLINSSRDIWITVKRPSLPTGRSYELRLFMVHEGVRWFDANQGAVAKIKVLLQPLPGIQLLVRERQTLQEARLKLAEIWGEQLFVMPDNYKSKLEILGKVYVMKLNPIKIAVTNKSKLPWPAIGKNSVQIGVIWVQKIKGKPSVNHVGEQFFPLEDTLLPGKRQIVEIQFDPLRYPSADEIWVGMVLGGKNWFYRWKDNVVKLARMRDLASVNIETVRAESLKILKEKKHLEVINFSILNKINDISIPDREKYRSRIRLNNAFPDGFKWASARAVMDIDLSITNMSSVAWPTGTDKPVTVGVLWFKKGSNPTSYTQASAEERFYLPGILMSGASVNMHCKILPKVVPGQYEVWIGLVHEGNAWFYEKGDSVLKLNVNVR